MKKYRLKKKNTAITVFILLLIIITIINPFERKAKSDLMNLNYQEATVDFIIDNGLKSETLKHEYSEFVDKRILDKSFKKENYSIYLDLDYYEKSNSVDLVNKLIEKKYSTEEINLILKSGNNNTIAEFVKNNKYEKLSDYLKYDYAKLSLIDRYIEYKASNVCTYKDAIIYVNIGLDNEAYENYREVDKFSLSMIVNKHNKLSESFIPDNLVDIPQSLIIGNGKEQANKVMLEAFSKMATDLINETTKKIYASNAYRSYEDQEKIYNKLLKEKGESYVNNSVSKPGFSEHQTGLVLNIDVVGDYSKSVEKEWLKNNAHKYGFILRYPDKKEDITGYKGITKQYRYVGEEIASYIAKNNITFEEYYATFLDKE
jgi:D-alanyl-D-alanine carboxypeptidase